MITFEHDTKKSVFTNIFQKDVGRNSGSIVSVIIKRCFFSQGGYSFTWRSAERATGAKTLQFLFSEKALINITVLEKI